MCSKKYIYKIENISTHTHTQILLDIGNTTPHFYYKNDKWRGQKDEKTLQIRVKQMKDLNEAIENLKQCASVIQDTSM